MDMTCPKCGATFASEVGKDFKSLCPKCLFEFAIAGEPTRKEGPVQTESIKLGPTFHGLEILERLGAGGMGVVYKARQKQLDRWVALKVLPKRMAKNTEFRERFEREAKALARLSHPNIVGVYDYGVEEGYTFFVMEYVEGVNLREVLREGKLSPHEALKIVPQLCDALEYAHGEGVVHRDIKPENILMDKRGCIKIADFGLAKLILGEKPFGTITKSNVVMGTPHYMAPEQVENPKAVDHRADIYSMGVVFYEMLTGELPIGKFEPPSRRVKVDVRLDEVVLKTLEKQPERRYQTAGEVKSEVDTIVSTAAQETIAAMDVKARASRMAVWSLILFFLSMGMVILGAYAVDYRVPWLAIIGKTGFTCSFLLVPGLAVVSLVRISRSGGKLAGRGYASCSIILWGTVVAAYVLFLSIHSKPSVVKGVQKAMVVEEQRPGKPFGFPFGEKDLPENAYFFPIGVSNNAVRDEALKELKNVKNTPGHIRLALNLSQDDVTYCKVRTICVKGVQDAFLRVFLLGFKDTAVVRGALDQLRRLPPKGINYLHGAHPYLIYISGDVGSGRKPRDFFRTAGVVQRLILIRGPFQHNDPEEVEWIIPGVREVEVGTGKESTRSWIFEDPCNEFFEGEIIPLKWKFRKIEDVRNVVLKGITPRSEDEKVIRQGITTTCSWQVPSGLFGPNTERTLRFELGITYGNGEKKTFLSPMVTVLKGERGSQEVDWLKPKGDELWMAGQEVTFEWNLPKPEEINSVHLDLAFANGESMAATIKDATQNSATVVLPPVKSEIDALARLTIAFRDGSRQIFRSPKFTILPEP